MPVSNCTSDEPALNWMFLWPLPQVCEEGSQNYSGIAKWKRGIGQDIRGGMGWHQVSTSSQGKPPSQHLDVSFNQEALWTQSVWGFLLLFLGFLFVCFKWRFHDIARLFTSLAFGAWAQSLTHLPIPEVNGLTLITCLFLWQWHPSWNYLGSYQESPYQHELRFRYGGKEAVIKNKRCSYHPYHSGNSKGFRSCMSGTRANTNYLFLIIIPVIIWGTRKWKMEKRKVSVLVWISVFNLTLILIWNGILKYSRTWRYSSQ